MDSLNLEKTYQEKLVDRLKVGSASAQGEAQNLLRLRTH